MQVLSGRLDRRIEILKPQAVKTDLGAEDVVFVGQGSRWAQRLRFQPSDDEGQEQRLAISRRDYLVRLDSLTRQMTTEWRVREGTHTAQIIGLDDEPRDGSLIIRCDQAER